VPFNAPVDRACRIFINEESSVGDEGVEVIEVADSNQYTIQGDLFSRAIREDTEVPVPLEDAIKNMRVIEAIFRAAGSGRWERVES